MRWRGEQNATGARQRGGGLTMRLCVKIACILIIGAVVAPDMASATKTISYNIKSMSRQQLDKWCGNHNGYPVGTDKPQGTYECNGAASKVKAYAR
jgi:hypothetical protein